MANRQVSQSKVVFLVNFLSPNLAPVMQEVQKRVGELAILVSVPMEANRTWESNDHGLPVVVQKTRTLEQIVPHPGGFTETLYVHVPTDTFQQLRAFGPDCIVSLEMGARTGFSMLYRLSHRRCRHVLAVYGSERSEAGRGYVRSSLRKAMVRSVDVLTYNGPSCYRYLRSLGAPTQRMVPWNYAADPEKIYRGPIMEPERASGYREALRLLTVSQLIPRKGIARALPLLSDWARENPDRRIHWTIAGTGPEMEMLAGAPLPQNLLLEPIGPQNAVSLQQLYRTHHFLFFPTLGDEWGLVVDEALASGLPVIGSTYSQAVETLVEPNRNGWSFSPEIPDSLLEALQSAVAQSPAEHVQMRFAARESVQSRTPKASALQFLHAVEKALSR